MSRAVTPRAERTHRTAPRTHSRSARDPGAPRDIPSAARAQDSTEATTRADSSREASSSRRGWPLILAGPLAAVAAVAMSLIVFAVPVFAIWLTAPSIGPSWDSWEEVLAIAVQVWGAAQGLPVVVGEVTITLLPWGLAIIPVGVLVLAGRWAARVSAVGRPVEAATVLAAGALAYATAATALAHWATGGFPGPGRVFLTTAALAAAALAVGVLTSAGLTRALLTRIPRGLRDVGAAATVAVGVLVIGGAVLVGVGLVLGSGEVQRMLAALAPDTAGFAAILLLSLGYLPVAVTWATSYALGTGVVAASGITVSPFAPAPVGELPALPLMAILPTTTPAGAQALPALGLLAGILAAATLRRRGAAGLRLLLHSVAVIATAAILLAGILAASSGALGGERLASLGPRIGITTGVACLLWAIGSLIIVIPGLLSSPRSDADESPWEPDEETVVARVRPDRRRRG